MEISPEYLRRLKETAAKYGFAFEEGEDFDSWIARVRQQHTGLRAFAAAAMVDVSRQMQAENMQRRRLWIVAARLECDPGERRPCFVCGKYQGITQAHHVVPLARQFELGYATASHEIEWLCPNHHILVHLHVDRLGGDKGWAPETAFDDVTRAESRQIGDLITRAVGKL